MSQKVDIILVAIRFSTSVLETLHLSLDCYSSLEIAWAVKDNIIWNCMCSISRRFWFQAFFAQYLVESGFFEDHSHNLLSIKGSYPSKSWREDKNFCCNFAHTVEAFCGKEMSNSIPYQRSSNILDYFPFFWRRDVVVDNDSWLVVHHFHPNRVELVIRIIEVFRVASQFRLVLDSLDI